MASDKTEVDKNAATSSIRCWVQMAQLLRELSYSRRYSAKNTPSKKRKKKSDGDMKGGRQGGDPKYLLPSVRNDQLRELYY